MYSKQRNAEVGKLIHDIRKEKKISVDWMAQNGRVSATTIRLAEKNGGNVVTMTELLIILGEPVSRVEDAVRYMTGGNPPPESIIAEAFDGLRRAEEWREESRIYRENLATRRARYHV